MNEARIQAALRDCARLSAAFASTAGDDDRAGAFSLAKADAMRAAGLCSLVIPEAFGGMGAGLTRACLALEALAKGDACAALGLAMHFNVMGAAAQSGSWRPAVYEALCAEAVARGIFTNSVHSEAEMGSPSRGGLPYTRAEPVSGGYALTGRKRWATYAPALDYFLTSATVDDGDVPQLGVFAVAAHSKGVELLDTWSDGLSLRASGSYDVILRDVFVDASRVVELRPVGAPKAHPLPPAWSCCDFGAVYLGIGEAALARFAAYCRARTPSALGKPIAALPAIRRAAGEIALALKGARALLLETARAWDTEPERRPGMAGEVAAAKTACVRASLYATERAVSAAGAGGLDRQVGLERHFRDARAGLLNPPQEDIALETLGQAALDEGADG